MIERRNMSRAKMKQNKKHSIRFEIIDHFLKMTTMTIIIIRDLTLTPCEEEDKKS